MANTFCENFLELDILPSAVLDCNGVISQANPSFRELFNINDFNSKYEIKELKELASFYDKYFPLSENFTPLKDYEIVGARGKMQVSMVAGGNELYTIIIKANFNSYENLSDSAKYKFLFETSADAIMIYDADELKILEFNNAALELLEYSAEELLNIRPYDISAEPTKTIDILKKIGSGCRLKIPCRYLKRKDGTVFPAELTTYCFDYEGKRLVSIDMRDITKRKTFENQLKDNEEQLLTLVNSTPDIICIKDGAGRWVLANDAILEMFDLKADEYKGKTERELAKIVNFHRNSFITCEESDKAAWEAGEMSRSDETMQKRSGEKKVYDVIKVPRFTKEGERKSLIVFGRDITQRKKAESILKDKAKEFESIYENAAVGIYRTDIYGKPMIANRAFLSMFGFNTLEDFLKINVRNMYVNPEDRTRFIAEALEKEFVKGFEADLFHSNGEKLTIRFNVRVVREDGDKVKYFEGIIEDITKKQEAQEILIKAKEEAEKSDQLKSEFLAQMSHEIRTPINSLLNSVGIIKEEIVKLINSDIESCIGIIDRSSHRIIRTIDSILNMSEIQTGTYDFKSTEFDVYEQIIKPLYRDYKHSAESKNISFFISKHAQSTSIVADEYSFSQIFSNLIDNAIKFTNEGRVEIKIFRDTYNHLNIEVIDTGIGISEEYLPNLFKPFTQEQQGYTRKYEGNGLGLALATKFCEYNNASMTVNSHKGEGSTFRVNFNQ